MDIKLLGGQGKRIVMEDKGEIIFDENTKFKQLHFGQQKISLADKGSIEASLATTTTSAAAATTTIILELENE